MEIPLLLPSKITEIHIVAAALVQQRALTPCRYNIFRVIRHRTKEDATAKVELCGFFVRARALTDFAEIY